MMATTYLDKKCEARKLIDQLLSDLTYLATAFEIVGNQKVSNELTSSISDLRLARKLYEGSFEELFNNAYAATQQATANMIQAAINTAIMMDNTESKKGGV